MTTPTIDCEILPAETPGLLNPQHHLTLMRQDAIGEINSFHRQATGAAEAARQKAEEASHYALLCGTRLEQLRLATPHGEWGKMFANAALRLTSNETQNAMCVSFDFSHKTAERYMEVAKRIRLDRNLSAKAVKRLDLIASAGDIDDEARAWLNKLTEGQTLRQLYLDLEIISAPAGKDPAAKTAPAKTGPKKTDKQVLLEDAREALFLWRESFEKLVKIGTLDDLDQPGLLELKEFLAVARDRVNARLQPAGKTQS